jgi:hypothetical protein
MGTAADRRGMPRLRISCVSWNPARTPSPWVHTDPFTNGCLPNFSESVFPSPYRKRRAKAGQFRLRRVMRADFDRLLFVGTMKCTNCSSQYSSRQRAVDLIPAANAQEIHRPPCVCKGDKYPEPNRGVCLKLPFPVEASGASCRQQPPGLARRSSVRDERFGQAAIPRQPAEPLLLLVFSAPNQG